jgi:hypothetical protein
VYASEALVIWLMSYVSSSIDDVRDRFTLHDAVSTRSRTDHES